MDRLTNNIDYCQLHCDFGKEKDCLFKDKSKCYENNMYNKLREYEIAEEQKLLLRLPCKVGDTVWFIKGGYYKQPKFCEVAPIKVTEISLKNNRSGKNLDWAIIANGIRYKISSIGKTVFLTKEEAEQTLKQMGE